MYIMIEFSLFIRNKLQTYLEQKISVMNSHTITQFQ